MGILDGGIRDIFSQAFGSFYLDGLLYRKMITKAQGGSKLATFSQGIPIKVQHDGLGRLFDPAQGSGPRVSSMIVLTIYDGIELPDPIEGDHITVDGTRWTVGTPISRDPAGSHFVLRVSEVAEGAAVNG